MPLLCLGLSHHTAPLALRERFAFPAAELEPALARLRSDVLGEGTELVVVSTCNRLELYLHTPVDDERMERCLVGWLAESCALQAAAFVPHLYRHAGVEAVRHLGRVAAGLDSLVLGEAQILGQVGAALALARRVGTAGPVVEAAFQAGIRAGRRARCETGINRNPASVSSVAVRTARSLAGALDRCRVVVVGGGKMGTLALRALRAESACEIVLVNRTTSGAKLREAARDAAVRPLSALPAALAGADLVLTSVTATAPILTRRLVREALASRPDRPLTLIDLAVPRNVDPAAGALPGVRLIDLDDLKGRAESVATGRRAEVPAVEAIVEEEVEAFWRWRRAAEMAPLIAGLRSKAEAIRMQEVERLLERLPELDPEVRAGVLHLSRALVNKLLHDPTTRLRSAARSGAGQAHARAVRELFDLRPSA